MVTKLGRVVNYDKGKPYTKAYDGLITCSLEVTRQIKKKISFPEGILTPNLARW